MLKASKEYVYIIKTFLFEALIKIVKLGFVIIEDVFHFDCLYGTIIVAN